MDLELTYEWYTEHYGQALDAEAFSACLRAAEARVQARCACHDLTALDDSEKDAYRRAVCAACEAETDPAVASWKAGKASMEYVDATSRSTDAAIERELSGTKLASCWVR